MLILSSNETTSGTAAAISYHPTEFMVTHWHSSISIHLPHKPKTWAEWRSGRKQNPCTFPALGGGTLWNCSGNALSSKPASSIWCCFSLSQNLQVLEPEALKIRVAPLIDVPSDTQEKVLVHHLVGLSWSTRSSSQGRCFYQECFTETGSWDPDHFELLLAVN